MKRSRLDVLGDRRDLLAVAGAVVLVVVAAVVGGQLVGHGVVIHAGAAPLFARIDPHVGPGSLLAVAVAAVLVAAGPRAATRWRWPPLLGAAALATLAWTVSLALVRGTQGLLAPLSAPSEYLADLPRIDRIGSIHLWLSQFSASIPATSPEPWRTHVSGHPPGMTLVFVLLDRVGLAGPGPAATVCVLGWVLAVVATAAAARSLAGEAAARTALPYLVLLPAAVWAGVSADALLAGVGALAGYLLCRATAPDRRAQATVSSVIWALAAGTAFGVGCFLSYGGALLAFGALAVVTARARGGVAVQRLIVVSVTALVGALSVYLAFRLAGFDWWEGYRAVKVRYFAGYGGTRPYAYWVWADFAALTIAAGPAVVAGLRRALARARPAGSVETIGSTDSIGSTEQADPIGADARFGLLALSGGALVSVAVAAATGLSKAEVERIWLPWIVWMALACALLPAVRTRRWLTVQVVIALLVEHLLRTPW